jgi:ABC-type branched-subunit amino acid transport system ATPase component
LREVMRDSHVGWYVLLALGVIGLADTLQGYAFNILSPEISRTLGIGRARLAGFQALKTMVLAAATIPLVMAVQKRPRRAMVTVVAIGIWACFALGTGFVVTAPGLLLVLLADGATSGAAGAVHTPLLVDSYPPAARVRVLAGYTAIASAGNIVAPLVVAALTTWGSLTWRGVFLVIGAFTALATLIAVRLRDPGFGRFDTARLRHLDDDPATVPDAAADDPATSASLGFIEISRRLLLIPTIRRQLVGWTVLGIMTVPYGTFLTFLLDERWGLGTGGRGVFSAAMSAVGLASLAAFGKRGELLLRRSPAAVVRLASWFVLLSTVTVAAAGLSPSFPLVVVLLAAGTTGLAVLSPALGALQLSIVRAEMRPHAIALAGIAAGFGGLTGSLYLSGIDRRFGIGGAMVALAIPGVVAALVLRTCARTVDADIDRMVDDVVEETRVSAEIRRGAALPLLAVRGVDAAYGDLQVLFGVDLVVHDGEMLALLGTNGSGKSTLLRVVSGLLLPQRGSVRLAGEDITYVSPQRRVEMGVCQVPGGRAVFGGLTVHENLRAYATTSGLSRRALEHRFERVYELFPVLADRLDQRAEMMSGGQQQMLALAKAVLLEPRLLLIDELSLGLAPAVVADLLDTLRAINAEGTAVVLVEQSVNVALAVADRAVFLEKGRVRFAGAGAELRGRDDLLRAVFLGEEGG